MKWKKSLSDRFWEKVDKRGPDECWPWTGALVGREGQRRGQIWNGERVIPAAKLALILTGKDVDGLWALHKCNNSICANPSHIYAGTPSDNIRDAIRAGTHVGNPAPSGSKNYSAKLTENDIPEILSLRRSGMTLRALGRKFSVSASAINKITLGRTWLHAR